MGKPASDAQTLRRQAREASARLREILELRDKRFGDLLIALSSRDDIDQTISEALHGLQDIEVSKGEISDVTGLSTTEINRLMRIKPVKKNEESGEEEESEKEDPREDSVENDDESLDSSSDTVTTEDEELDEDS